jgi:hypothetical protein
VFACNAQVLLHYEAFRQEGARVTYKEFDFGHLDFTFAVRFRIWDSMLFAVCCSYACLAWVCGGIQGSGFKIEQACCKTAWGLCSHVGAELADCPRWT